MRRLAAILTLCCLTAGPVLASPQSAYAAALTDARKLTKDDACQTRYLDASNIPEGERPELFAVLCGWVNHLSREADIAAPRVVRGDLYAVRLGDYGWLAKVWDAQRVEPYYHERVWTKYSDGYWRVTDRKAGFWVDPTTACELEKLTGTRTPVVRADFFLFYSSRQLDLRNRNNTGFGYLDWLQLKERKDVEALAGLDTKKAIKLGKELRAVIEQGRSGIAQLDRQIQWFATYGDGRFGYWQTLDTFDPGDGNGATQNLKAGTFKHNAEELLFGLPNGHVGMFLNNDQGAKQDTAPDQIGGIDAPLRKGRDLRIHVGQCHFCHTNGMLQDVDDWARRNLQLPLQIQDKDYQEFLRLKRQYMRSLEAQIELGRQQYSDALKASCGLTSEQFARLHARFAYRYRDHPRTAEVLAVEMGCTEERLTGSLKKAFDKRNYKLSEKERQRLAPLTALIAREPGSVPILKVEELFQDLQCLVREYGP